MNFETEAAAGAAEADVEALQTEADSPDIGVEAEEGEAWSGGEELDAAEYAEEPFEEEAPDGGTAEKEEPRAPLFDERDGEILRLKKQNEDYDAFVKKALAKIGIEGESGKEALIKLAAEADDVTPEEYAEQHEREERERERDRLARAEAFEKRAAADLAAVHAAFPETAVYKTVRDLPNVRRFGELMDMGLTPKEAYIAANPDAVRGSVAAAVKKSSLAETKEHLRSSVPRGAKDLAPRMSREQLIEYREMFPDLSDKEIARLYRGAVG